MTPSKAEIEAAAKALKECDPSAAGSSLVYYWNHAAAALTAAEKVRILEKTNAPTNSEKAAKAAARLREAVVARSSGDSSGLRFTPSASPRIRRKPNHHRLDSQG